ncbi:hypothetical protein MHU86_18216 [Fragilaria crotonensis]|nr:hypothetical protein MHU86_18216 [Fragilaria crotonensis]
MPFMTTPMDTDDQTDWIPVMGRRRSKSPPKSTDNEPPPTNNTTTVSPDRLLESLEDESPSSLALSAFKSATKQNPPKRNDSQSSPGLKVSHLLLVGPKPVFAEGSTRVEVLQITPVSTQPTEARYRDKIPGLPDVIHIQAEIAANVSFLDKLSTAAGWHDNIQEQVSTFPNARAEGEVNRAQNHISKRRSEGSPEWPTPMEASNPMRPLRNAWKTKQGQVAADLNSAGGDTSIGTDEDRSAGSTHSLTHASRTSSDTKFLALEVGST